MEVDSTTVFGWLKLFGSQSAFESGIIRREREGRSRRGRKAGKRRRVAPPLYPPVMASLGWGDTGPEGWMGSGVAGGRVTVFLPWRLNFISTAFDITL